jgi:iron complex transport system permease protein
VSLKSRYILLLLGIVVLLLFVADLLLGSVYIPFGTTLEILLGRQPESVFSKIILNFRLPKAITAVLAGAALSVCGLQMQTLFRNPLAGPYVLGINSGASLGVAIVLLTGVGTGMLPALFAKVSVVLAATTGAALLLLLVVFVSRYVRDNVTLLILGLMFGHITGALEGMLQYFTRAENLQGFIIWSLGSFSNVVWNELSVLAPAILLSLLVAFALSKPLNALLLGESYAASMGVNLKRSRLLIILSSGMLAGSITAFCGPVAFLGTAIPHLARGLFRTSDHRLLMPAVCLTGALVALVCDLVAQLPGTGLSLPVNAVTSLIGAPVVIYIILKQRQRKSAFSS